MNKNFTIKTGQTPDWSLTIRKVATLITLFFLTQTLVQASAFLDVTVSSTDASCGANDGTATAMPTNGWAPFTYQWSNGATTQSISGLAPGTYSVTVVDVDGAIASGSTVVGQSGLNLFLSASYETCPGSADGTASVNVSGGVEPISYLWSTGETFVVASGLSAGDYTVTATDANGCTGVGSITVELSPEGIWLMTTTTDADCGLANGTAYVSVMTGVAPFTIEWSDGQTGTTATGLAAGNYTVTVTDSNGCTNSETVSIGSNSDLDISISGTDAECGADNGTATVSVNGGTAPFTYAWSNGGNTATITNLSAGTYGVTVTDVDGCSNAASIDIAAQDGLELTVTGTDANCNDNDGTASANVSGGSAPYTYSWSNGGNTATITGLAPGTYSVTATDSNGCGAVGSVTISGSSVDGGFIITTDLTQICVGDGENDIIDVTLSGNIGSNSQWLITTPGLEILGLFDAPPFNFENAPPGVCVIWHLSYEGTVTGLDVGANAGNLAGCFDLSNSIEVLREDCCILDGGDLSTTSNTSICAGDGIDDPIDVALTGNTGSNQAWVITDQSGNILGLPAGPPFNLEGAGAGVCLIWSISYEDGLTGLETGLNVSGLDGCYELSGQSITVTRYLAPTISLNGADISCNGGNNGSVTVNITDGTAPFSYSWSNGATTASITGLSAGTYSVVVTDANGCSDDASVTLSESDAISLTTSSTDASCNGGSDGSASATANGGVAPFTYAWSNGATTASISGLSAGTYGVTVTDANGCTGEAGVTISEPTALSLSTSGTDVSCNGESDGSVSVTVSGGTAPYTYAWSNGATAASISGLSAGTYTITVTDANGCSASADVTVEEPSPLSLTYDGGDETCIGSADGFAVVNVSGGTAPYTYLWSNGATTATASGLSAGTYGVTVTDANGCVASNSTAVTIISNGITSCSAMVTSSYNEGVDISTFGGSDGSASVNVFGGTAPLSYTWSNGQSGATATGLNAGTYTVDITDANGCSCSAEVTLIDPSKIGNFVFDDVNRNGIQNGGELGIADITVTLTGTATNGTSVNRMVMTDMNGAYSFDGLLPGNYKVTFTGGDKASPKGAGGDDALDSDINEDTGMTDYFDLGVAECNNDIDAGFYDCVNIGDYVFYDGNRDGVQQPWEPGVADVSVILKNAGPDGIICNEDDEVVDGQVTGNDGRYLFECVLPGEYYIQFGLNSSENVFTDNDQGGNDELDSDANPVTGKTPPFTVVEGMDDDLSFDAGIYPICDDFTNGGEIGYDQDLCIGEEADPIVSVSLPSGGYGDTEYLWLKSTIGGSLTNGSWSEIPNVDAPTYAPGFLSTTTFYIRCARREGCDNFVAESNVVVIEVNSCGNNGFVQNLSADIMANSRVAIHWDTEPENGLYRYHIERSADMTDFDAMGSVEGLGNQQTMNRYEYMDNTPRIGRNIYRIVRENLSNGEIMYSNTVEVVFNPAEQKFFAYPNPTSGDLFIESILNMNGNATLEIYAATGQLLEVVQVNEQDGKATINLDNYAAGSYFVKVQFEDNDDIEVIRIIKE